MKQKPNPNTHTPQTQTKPNQPNKKTPNNKHMCEYVSSYSV